MLEFKAENPCKAPYYTDHRSSWQIIRGPAEILKLSAFLWNPWSNDWRTSEHLVWTLQIRSGPNPPTSDLSSSFFNRRISEYLPSVVISFIPQSLNSFIPQIPKFFQISILLVLTLFLLESGNIHQFANICLDFFNKALSCGKDPDAWTTFSIILILKKVTSQSQETTVVLVNFLPQ